MILFEEDWLKYPTATIDLETRNQSFVRIAALYKKMGIRNNCFMLALINPDLKGVDPHDPNLNLFHKGMIAQECMINPWYFFREVARAPARGTFGGNPIEANRGNIALWWCFFNHVYTFLIQPRQTGKSMSTDALVELLMLIECKYTTINLMTKDDKLRRENIERIRGMMELLPPYLYIKDRGDSENFEEITINRLNNRYKTHVPRSSPKDAHNLGRGMTTPILHIDEGPFQKNIQIAMEAAIPGMGAATDIAKENGTPYGIIQTTTAGKKDDRDGKYVYGLLQGAAVWSEHFLDAKNHADLERLVRLNSKGGGNGRFRVNITMSHRQLGKSDEWLAQKLEEAEQSGEVANRDYFNVWTSGNETLPFSIELAEIIRESQKDVLYQQITKEGFILRWYVDEMDIPALMRDRKFVLAIDPSEAGKDSDYMSLVLMDVETLEVVACGSYTETNLIVFSKWIAELLVQYENVTAIIERRSSGQTIIDQLLLILPQFGIDPFKRIFNVVVNDFMDNPERYHEVRGTAFHRRDDRFYNQFKTTFGFATSGSGKFSRTELYSTTLLEGLKRGGHGVNDNMLICQMLGLVRKNGRVDHADGEHDDLVIGWLLAIWLLLQGKNLSYYGIDTSRICSQINANKEDFSPMELMLKEDQMRYRDRIEELQELLLKENNEHIAMKLEQELRLMSRKIVLEEGEIFSVDQLIRSINENKRKDKSKKRLEQHQSDRGQNNYRNPYAIYGMQGHTTMPTMAMRRY